jgi:phage tail sheath protein FI
MPSTLNAPGIYIEELPSGVHPIAGVSTSDTAFVDWFPRGPVSTPTRITSFDELTRVFGGLHPRSEASYGVFQYFQHGGAVAWVVRLEDDGDASATLTVKDGSGGSAKNALVVSAANPGSWGNSLQVAVITAGTGFSLFVRESKDGRVVDSEVVRNLSDPVSAVAAVNAQARLVRLGTPESGAGNPVSAAATATGDAPDAAYTPLKDGTDAVVSTTGLATKLTDAMSTLTSIEPFVFNILSIPAMARLDAANQGALVTAASTFCVAQRAFLLVDPPEGTTTATAAQGLLTTAAPASPNAAMYYPRLVMPDPADSGRPRNIGPSGVVAGVYARTDATRGVWKAPAGIDAVVGGVTLAVPVTESDSAALNPLGINALRTLPVVGNVVWGARTLFGADARASEWKYIPVRRTASYIEQSLHAGISWVVFEPNDEPLWSQIRLNVGSFMQDLFRRGAFAGSTPREAFFVRCDKNTTTRSDVDKGIVNILVGFAPLKPAEFVVIQIQQMAGQATV